MIAGFAALLALHGGATAQERSQSADTQPLVLPPTGGSASGGSGSRIVTLTLPLRDSGTYVGDIVVEIQPDGSVRLPPARLLDLLAGRIHAAELDRLRAKRPLTAADLDAAGLSLRYNPQELALDLVVSIERRATQILDLTGGGQAPVGEFVAPSRFSAYLNMRGSADYVHGEGVQSPVVYLDGAARLGDVVAEGEGFWQSGASGNDWQRVGSRLVHDDRDRLIRWTAGDLIPVGRGFQAVPDLLGISAFRSYGLLQPQRVALPRGGRSFSLARPSTVEVQVNGQLVRRMVLQPGNYDLRDFPFAQGANDVRLSIVDDAGRTQTLQFNIFLDQTQLGQGLTEFGFYGGLRAGVGSGGRVYSGDFAATGYVRHGLNDRLTLGANLQGDRRSQMGGVEALWSAPVGSLGVSLAVSRLSGWGTGSAAVITFQRLIRRPEASDTLSLFFERRSRNWGALGTLAPSNPFQWEAGGGYSRALTATIFAGVDGRYSKGRDDQRDIWSLRGTAGAQISGRLSLSGELRWERDTFERRFSGLLTATLRIGSASSLRAEYDTRFERARLSWSTFQGNGVGAYNISADLDRSAAGTGANATLNYFGNRAELGLSHFGTFDSLFGASLSQRTSARFATSLAFADGVVAMGRPINDSFAIVKGHSSLRGARIDIEPTPYGQVARSGTLGPGVHPSLAAYVNRTVTVDAPEAPPTAALGQGSFRLHPGYRSGYLLTVGSEWNVTAVGRLVDPQGAPVPLISGTITAVDRAGPGPVAIFTNRQGRFGAVGIGAGRWRIQTTGEPGLTYELNIAPDAEGILSVGDLKPESPKP